MPRAIPILLGAGAAVGLVFVARSAFAGEGGAVAEGVDVSDYAVPAGAEYGPFWKSRRPPGLPPNARQCSTAAEGRRRIEEAARAAGLGDAFVRFVLALGRNESGHVLARPANNFNSLPPSERGGASLITACGWHQYNRGAWHTATDPSLGLRLPTFPNRPDLAHADPCMASVADELAIPVLVMAACWSDITSRGGSELDAARAYWLWHDLPGEWSQYRRAASFSSAWPNFSGASAINGKLSRNGFA